MPHDEIDGSDMTDQKVVKIHVFLFSPSYFKFSAALN